MEFPLQYIALFLNHTFFFHDRNIKRKNRYTVLAKVATVMYTNAKNDFHFLVALCILITKNDNFVRIYIVL